MARADIADEMEDARMKTDLLNLETNALEYDFETRRYHAEAIWQQGQAPRRRVFAIRDQVFGTSARKDVEKPRFNRVQRSVGGRERLVDRLGRTESEAEEEEGLPEMAPEGEEGEEAPVPTQSRSSHAWFLEFFARWGRNLGVRVGGGGANSEPPKDAEKMKTFESMSRPVTPLRKPQPIPASTSPRSDKSSSDEDLDAYQDAKTSFNN